MKHVLWLCSVALLVAGCGQPLTASPPPTVPAPQPVAEGFSRSAMLDDIANLVILPAYEQFTERTATLQEAARTLSDAPTAANLQATRQAWREAVLAWQPLRLFILDDIRRTLLHSGVNKWPTNTEFIEQFIAEEATLDAALIAGAGSTSKGVPALEYLLFSPTGDDAAVLAALTNDPRRMQYVVALTQDLHTTALALQEAWTQPDEGYVIEFVSNDSGGAMMQSSVSELSNELVNALEMLVQTRLGEPLGRANGGEPQPALVEAPTAMHQCRPCSACCTAFGQRLRAERGRASMITWTTWACRPKRGRSRCGLLSRSTAPLPHSKRLNSRCRLR
ncbi:MAG: imelysin family protein [Chloroflexaceae bacterium]|nr:imelysin family protein [Chloroflexaceae bacterium]